MRRRPTRRPTLPLAAGAFILVAAGTAHAWGADGHRIVGRVAVEGLPAEMPAFFTDAADQLAYLNPEPDRWRDDEMRAMNEAWTYDHYIDLENVPEGALDAPDRFTFLAALYEAGVEAPHQSVGFLPYRIHELWQRLASGSARWHVSASDDERRWIERRILNDAGILGHYVADASQPHHTTIHYNGWAADAPNPAGYTTARDFHWRFESRFVSAHVTLDDVRAAAPAGTETLGDIRAAIHAYILDTHRQVVPLYELEQTHGFDPDAPAHAETRDFTIRRLAAASAMLRALWWSAWIAGRDAARG